MCLYSSCHFEHWTVGINEHRVMLIRCSSGSASSALTCFTVTVLLPFKLMSRSSLSAMRALISCGVSMSGHAPISSTSSCLNWAIVRCDTWHFGVLTCWLEVQRRVLERSYTRSDGDLVDAGTLTRSEVSVSRHQQRCSRIDPALEGRLRSAVTAANSGPELSGHVVQWGPWVRGCRGKLCREEGR